MEKEMVREAILGRVESCQKLLVGLGEEWNVEREDPRQVRRMQEAYRALYRLVKKKDYFIVTMAMDALIFDSPLGSRTEEAFSSDQPAMGDLLAGLDGSVLEKFDRLFPGRGGEADTRFERISAPCGNVTWRQCSVPCTKDIWEPGEVPADVCPHCGAPLTGNTIKAKAYIEEGYMPQWNRYTQWLSKTFRQELLILELGVGFSRPGVIRFPFEKTAFFNQKSFLFRIHGQFPQVDAELGARAVGIRENSVVWMAGMNF